MRRSNSSRSPRVHLVSLGCAKNLVDSEKLLGSLGARGAAVASGPQDSDVIIVNTCGFIAPALAETEREIERLARRKGRARLYVYGCAVNRYRGPLAARHPGVDAWFSLGEQASLVRAVVDGCSGQDIRLLSTRGFAYLKIAEGCSNRCSYCTIPAIRGPYRSAPLASLVAEARALARLGVRELILIAQDTTRYGRDLPGQPDLAALLAALSRVPDIAWLRVLYVHPRSLDEAAIAEIERNPKVCKYLDLPIQHINDRLLGLMNRRVDRRRIEYLVDRLRRIPGMTLRTTMIAGFPTETEDEFRELVDFARQGAFDWVGVFPYSAEPGTRACAMPQLTPRVIERRYRTLLAAQTAVLGRNIAARVDTTATALVHGYDGLYRAHAQFCAPDSDSEITIAAPRLRLGTFQSVRITGKRGKNFYACRA